MNRRSFLKWLGVGSVVAAVAPTALFEQAAASMAPHTGYTTYVMGKDAVLGAYGEYANFSSFAIASSIKEGVADTAAELSYRMGVSLAELRY